MSRDRTASAAGPQQVTTHAILAVFLPFAAGYYASYIFRTIGAIVADRLQADLALSASDLGVLTPAYFIAFAVAQLPLGLMLDRFGARRVQGVLLCVGAAGSLVFALADGLWGLWAGRALIGLGFSGGLMAGLKAITEWFPKRRWPLVNGLFLAMGGLGAITATAPVEALLQVTSWRGIFIALAGLTLTVAALVVAAVPEPPRRREAATLRAQLAGIAAIYRDRFFWRLAPMALVCMATSFAIQTLWAGPWLRDVAGLSRGGVAATLFAMTCAMTFGFVFWGWLTERLERAGIAITATYGGGVAIYLLALGAIVLALDPDGLWPWIGLGLTGNISALAFTLLARHVPLAYAGRANTALNLLVFLGAFLAQAAIGAILDLWPADAGRYPAEAYRVGFGCFWLLCLASWLWFLVAARWARPGQTNIR